MISQERRETLTPSTLLEIVADHFVVSSDDILSTKRNQNIVIPRYFFVYLSYNELNMTQEAIGQYLGKDHSTVKHGLDKMEELLKNDESMRMTIEVLRKKLSAYNT